MSIPVWKLRFTACVFVAVAFVHPTAVHALPAPGPLEIVSPKQNAVETTSVNVQLDAACTIDLGTLAVSLNGTMIPAASFSPFSACMNGRMTSQVVNLAINQPTTTITSGPTSANVGDNGTYTAQIGGGADGVTWNFDGAAPPSTSLSTGVTFHAQGQFELRAQATDSQSLAASVMDGGNLVQRNRAFVAGDPTPALQTVQVTIGPDIDFVNFESSQVHPIALSETGDSLYALNTDEGRLAIFDVAPGGGLSFAWDVVVGLDPVSLAVRGGTNEVWVANHLSNSVSIVDVSLGQVVETLAVGDEPTDLVFASGRAFVTLAGNEERVKVYDASTRAQIAALDIFSDDPRALATNVAGTEVYVVALESGNGSTILFEPLVEDGGGQPAPNPPRQLGTPAPQTGLIVQFNPATGDFEDDTGADWSDYVAFGLPDLDVFVIDADAGTPSIVKEIPRVGTTLFDVAVHPSGLLFVPNTDARNLIRFEPNLRGHLVETRISVVNTAGSGTVTPVDLNSHINFSVTPGPAGEIADSLAHPGDGVFSSDGNTYYVTALGSRKVGVLDSSNPAAPVLADRIDVGEGPSGVALLESESRLYVLNRFDNTISTVDTGSNQQIDVIGVAGASQFNASPDVIQVGRKFLYDGQLSSGHGDVACATCHISGNFDNLAWDLGDPEGAFVDYDDAPWVTFGPLLGPSTDGFDPMKGPMTTQSLRGLKDMEPFHWRGDRQDFHAFNPAFIGLMGRASELSSADMDAFTAFINTVRYPPNPYRNLDDSLPASIMVPFQGNGSLVSANPTNGQNSFINDPLDANVFTCNQCHLLPTGTTTNLFNGNAEGESQDFKIPQMRNMYEKVGFNVVRPGLLSGDASNINTQNGGDMRAGYGFVHDGGVSLTEFLAASVFNMGLAAERDMFAFALAFPTGMPAAVGAQITISSSNKNSGAVTSFLATLISQAEAGNCDVIAKGTVSGQAVGYVYDTASNKFLPDSIVEASKDEAALRGEVTAGDNLTITGVPAGAGRRLGIDRDRDTWLDRTEVALGFDPADPNSNPWGR